MIWANKVNFPGQLLSSTCPTTVQLSELSRNWNNYSHGRLSSTWGIFVFWDLEAGEASALLTPKNGQAVNKSRHFDDILHDFLKQVLKSKSERSFVLFSTYFNLRAKIQVLCVRNIRIFVPKCNFSSSRYLNFRAKTTLVVRYARKKSDIWG